MAIPHQARSCIETYLKRGLQTGEAGRVSGIVAAIPEVSLLSLTCCPKGLPEAVQLNLLVQSTYSVLLGGGKEAVSTRRCMQGVVDKSTESPVIFVLFVSTSWRVRMIESRPKQSTDRFNRQCVVYSLYR